MTMPTIDLGYPTPARGKIPSFRSVEEEAAFWDAHDLTDFMDDTDRVTLTVGGELGEQQTGLTTRNPTGAQRPGPAPARAIPKTAPAVPANQPLLPSAPSSQPCSGHNRHVVLWPFRSPACVSFR
jgi:hypothetical protein